MRAPPLLFRRRPPQSNCPPATVPERVCLILVSTSQAAGWYFTVGSTRASARASKPPTYATQQNAKNNDKLQ
jgi:hypothetical protein